MRAAHGCRWMNRFSDAVPSWAVKGAVAAAALGAMALYNNKRAREAEAEAPPLGQFIELDGVKLHYLDRGEGPTILLLHGNGTMIEDFIASGVIDRLAAKHRVIAVDRPGFGHSTRPFGRVWTPTAQAALIARLLDLIQVERPLVVGHSLGTQIALALALDHPEKVAGLVLLSGYYYPSLRGDVVTGLPTAPPVLGDAMAHTVTPMLGRMLGPAVRRVIFDPAPVPERFAGFPLEMALRPAQMRAMAADGALMIPAAAALAKRYGELRVPITIVAGDGDLVAFPHVHAERLHNELGHSRLKMIEGQGHMVHHSATDQVCAVIAEAAAA